MDSFSQQFVCCCCCVVVAFFLSRYSFGSFVIVLCEIVFSVVSHSFCFFFVFCLLLAFFCHRSFIFLIHSQFVESQLICWFEIFEFSLFYRPFPRTHRRQQSCGSTLQIEILFKRIDSRMKHNSHTLRLISIKWSCLLRCKFYLNGQTYTHNHSHSITIAI